MIGANKILTVSYGTFSCTLEGFDEPFSTMKAIAEYFRDLAAEDRYFGAEPPTPDAEMLHRIAEREIHRRVEARISQNGVVLRPEGLAAEEPAPVPAAAPRPVVAEAPAPQPVAPAPVQAAPAAPARPGIEDSIAAKLRRIRAVVAEAQATPVAAAAVEAAYEEEEPASGLNGYAEPMDDDFGFVLDMDAGPDIDLAVPQRLTAADESAGIEEPAVAEQPEEPMAETAAAEPGEFDDAEATQAEPAGEAGEIAVAADDFGDGFEEDEAETALATHETTGEAEAEAEPAEPETADFDMADFDMAELLRAAAPAEPVPAEAEAPEPVAGDLSATPAESLALPPLVLSAAEAVAAPDDVTVAMEAEAADDEDESAWEDWQSEADEAEEDGAEAGELAELAPAEEDAYDDEDEFDDLRADATAGDEAEAEVDDSAWAVSDDDAGAEEDLRAVLTDEAGEDSIAAAQSGADADAIAAAPEQAGETAYDEDEGDIAAAPEPRSSLASLLARAKARVLHARAEDTGHAHPAAETPAAPEAEEDDSAILAGIEAAMDSANAPAPQAEDTRSPEAAELSRSAAEARALLQAQAEDGGEVERLMEEANTKIEGAENRRRFSAISHLKAAVAATVADRLLKPKDAPAEPAEPHTSDLERYRDDLSHAVRPRRPEVEPTRTTLRPAAVNRPAPLVLVSEQRVDRSLEADDQSVVRPRRVSTGNVALSDDDAEGPDLEPLSPEEARSFTEFAERLGARSLPELLEAAAVYTATIEGMADFSRPHLLRQVNAASDSDDYSREDYLRSFGTLLRQGKIQKVQRGRFSVTEASTFMTEARRAAH